MVSVTQLECGTTGSTESPVGVKLLIFPTLV